MEGVKVYVRDDKKFVSVKGIVTTVADYNAKSVRFVAKTNTQFGDIAGFRATSIETPILEGEELTFSCELGLLTGETSTSGESANHLWSTSMGSSDNLSDDVISALKNL